MTAAITLAGPDNLNAVLSLMARCHEERGLNPDDAHLTQIVSPLLDGSPLGAVWTIGPARAPLGYVMVTFGWSIEHGGMIGWVADVYVRPSVRRRGIGTEVLHAVAVSLQQAGVKALHAAVPKDAPTTASFCKRVGFDISGDDLILTDVLTPAI